MELWRALGALIEPPEAEHQPLAAALGLGPQASAAEHTELFVFDLYPYASVYLGAGGVVGGEARDRIAGFWRALGAAPPPEPDHLTVMLALHAELAEARGGRPRQARKAHLWEHLVSWLFPYLERLADLAPPFYRRWGALVEEALVAEVAELGRQERLSLHLRAAPALADPRQRGGAAFLAALLSPVESGLILVRDDLRRAADELGLGLRIGERRYVLEAFFSQEPRAILGWLADEAADRARRHRRRREILGPVAESWARRAAATADLCGELRRQAAAS